MPNQLQFPAGEWQRLLTQTFRVNGLIDQNLAVYDRGFQSL